ncbi:MAG: isopropylmalate isomerase, partial [Clostridiales bacterium]|nr:isopropylmalate isomerase [Clostridiales bacterium]
MPKTLFEKVWGDHCIKHIGKKEDLLYIDMQLLHEVNTPQAFDRIRAKKRTIRHPELTLATVDHNTPTKSKKSLKVDDIRYHQINLLEKNCEQFGIPFNALGECGQGITHVIAPDQGLVLSGSTLVCCDSHTTTHGAFAALAIGIGSSQVEHVLTTQTLRIQQFKTMRIIVSHKFKPGISAKDLAL